MIRTNCCAAVLVLMCGMIGCSGGAPDAQPTAEISFKVTIDGKPVAGPGIDLVFQPTGKGAISTIPVDAQGSGKGKAVVGANLVRLTINPSANPAAEPPGPDGAHGGAKGKGIGAAFFGDRSTLKADVQKGATFTFEVGTAAGEAADKAAPAAPSAHRGQ